jgi:hypothetical protein
MVNWMQADLAKANANRAAVPWIISGECSNNVPLIPVVL